MTAARRERIQSIDALRGLCLILMIAYHFAFDLSMYALIPTKVVFNPLLAVLEPFFACVFILLSGVSSRFSRSNVRRGFKTLIAALIITIITTLFGMPDIFGILHFLGCAMIIYGVGQRFFDRVPERWAPYIYLPLFFILKFALDRRFDIPHLWILGIADKSFSSSDYFPIFPYIFIFLLGTWLGKLVVERRLPKKFYTFDTPFLPAIGRKSLIIYMLHQPVLIGITLLLDKILTS